MPHATPWRMRALLVIASLLTSATAGACTIVDMSGAYRGSITETSVVNDGGRKVGTIAHAHIYSASRLAGFRSDTTVIRTNGSVAGYVVGSNLLSARGVVIATGHSCTADQLAAAHLTLF